jgi:UDPglucose 6-dehydrogenase
VAAYWESVVKMNDWQKSRFSGRIVRDLFNTVSGKHITILGFAFKKDTNDTRETAAIAVCRDLLAEGARVVVYDPQVSEDQIRADVLECRENSNLVVVASSLEACEGAHAVAILTEWDEFKDLDFRKIYDGMLKPAFLFDGRNILPHAKLREIGFRLFAIGKPA